jgi:hypothetical protein
MSSWGLVNWPYGRQTVELPLACKSRETGFEEVRLARTTENISIDSQVDHLGFGPNLLWLPNHPADVMHATPCPSVMGEVIFSCPQTSAFDASRSGAPHFAAEGLNKLLAKQVYEIHFREMGVNTARWKEAFVNAGRLFLIDPGSFASITSG